MTACSMELIEAAMQASRTWPKALIFENTRLDANLAKNVALLMNQHPLGFQQVTFLCESHLDNNGMQAIADNLNQNALQNVDTFYLLDCGLAGEAGGQAICDMLKKCGNSLEFLGISGRYLENSGIQA
eukprot:Platyproteum_vivax@DN1292_c0_g1_i3.p1